MGCSGQRARPSAGGYAEGGRVPANETAPDRREQARGWHHGGVAHKRTALIVVVLLALLCAGLAGAQWLLSDAGDDARGSSDAPDGTADTAPERRAPAARPTVGPSRRVLDSRAEERELERWRRFERLVASGRIDEALAHLALLLADDPTLLADADRAELARSLIAAAREKLLRLATAGDREAVAELLARIAGVLGELDEEVEAQALAAEAERALTRPAEITWRGSTTEARIARHVGRFATGGSPTGSDHWVDRRLVAFVEAPPARVKNAEPLPRGEPEVVEERRLGQLEKLRESNALELLDPIHGALIWLADHQGADGSFSVKSARKRCRELEHDPTCIENAPGASPVATAALAVLAFLDFRDQDARGVFETTLQNGVHYLLAERKKDGLWGGRSRYYTAGIALMALGQAAESSDREDLREAITAGLTTLAAEAGPNGGLQYRPRARGDLSVTAWIAQALEAAEKAKAEVPDAFRRGLERYFTAAHLGDGKFPYLVGASERRSLVPAGILTGLVLGPGAEDPLLRVFKRRMEQDAKVASKEKRIDLYTLYYYVRIAVRFDGRLEEPWHERVAQIAEAQVTEGTAAGTWPEKGVHARWISRGGPVLKTAFATLILEHALYRR